MRKIIFTSSILAHPAIGGPELRIENSIKALGKIADVYLVSRVEKRMFGDNKAEKFYKKYCKEVFYTPSIINLSRNLLIRKVELIFKKYEDSDADFLVRIAARYGIKVIWFGYGNISLSLIRRIKNMNPMIKIVCDTDSIWSKFILRRIPFESDLNQRRKIEREGIEKRDEERELVSLSDVITAVSEVDAAYYKKFTQKAGEVKVFSNAIDEDCYKNIYHNNRRKPYIYLSGSFGPNSPMEDGAKWFVNEIFPFIKKRNPQVYLKIIGRNADSIMKNVNDSRIEIRGVVKSTTPYLYGASVAVVPLRFESGTRFKILEAGICGIPVVSTSLGAEGLRVRDGENILIADKVGSFAEAVIKLLDNPTYAKAIAKNCRRLIKRSYTINSLVKEGREILNYLSNE